MQLRFMLHEIRKAADEGMGYVNIYKYELSALSMNTLTNGILRLAGFKSREFVKKDKEKKSEIEMLNISWDGSDFFK